MRSRARDLLLPAAAAAAAIAVVAAIVPELPPLQLLGGDAPAYVLMAENPLEPIAQPPAAQRVATPLLVAILPLDTADGFLLLSVVSTVLASVLVALICRELGLPQRLQVGAAVLTAASYIGVHGVFNQYYVDPETLVAVSLAFLLGLKRRELAFALALAVGVAFKEIVVTLVVLPYLLWRPPGTIWSPRLAGRTILLALPAILVFGAIQGFAPQVDPAPGTDPRGLFFLSFDPDAGLGRGFLTSVVNPFFALLGATWVLWPLGLLQGPAALKRAHLWVLLVFPILAVGSWERTMGVFVPLAIVTAAFALRSAPPGVLAAFAAGSFWVSGVVGAITIGDDGTTAAFKGALIAPGLAVAWGALGWELWRRWKLGQLPIRRPDVRAGRA